MQPIQSSMNVTLSVEPRIFEQSPDLTVEKLREFPGLSNHSDAELTVVATSIQALARIVVFASLRQQEHSVENFLNSDYQQTSQAA